MVGRQSYRDIAADMAGRLPEIFVPAMERLGWGPERLTTHRCTALSETLTFAVERSRWHARRLAGIALDAIGPDDLDSLPVMTKRDLMANWDDVVTDPQLDLASARSHLERLDDGPAFLLDEYHVFTTGGSSGEPAVLCWSQDELLRWLSSVGRWTLAAGISPPQRIAWVGARALRHPSAAVGVLVASMRGGTPLLVPVDQPVGDILVCLNEAQPDSLLVVSSMLPELTKAACEGALRIDVNQISVGGDPLDRDVAAAAADVFGAPVLEGYPTTDVGHIAQQAPGEDGLYVNEDFLVVEPVDEHDNHVAPGEDSHHILVTSLHQRTLPLIRYRIDDRVRIDPEGGRHTAYRKIAAIEGRTDDLFVYATVTVHPHVFRAVFARYLTIRDYRVTQTADGAAVALAASGDLDPGAVAAELMEALGRAGVPDAQVGVSVHDELPRTDVGKRLRFVPLHRHP